MTTPSVQISFDAADPARLAAFWAVALGYVLQPPPPGFDSWDAFADSVGIPLDERDRLSAVVDPEGAGPRLLFQKVPEGKSAKNRVHLDVNVGAGLEGDEQVAAVDAHARRLVEAGATEVARKDEHGDRWWVLLDPEGNEFCVQ